MKLIFDYGIGNSKSILNMMQRIGLDAEIGTSEEQVERADFCILPGVGSFDSCVKSFTETESSDYLLHRIANGLNVLGICVGMQMLFESSEEGELPGLSLIPGKVIRFDFKDKDLQEKIPHMSWNYLEVKKDIEYFRNYTYKPKFYFVHSFHADCSDKYVSSYSHYGYQFPASVKRGNINGFQFHPEKSHVHGKKLLTEFFYAC